MIYDNQADSKDDGPADSKDDGPVEWISYWKPNVTMSLVDDFTKYVSFHSVKLL